MVSHLNAQDIQEDVLDRHRNRQVFIRISAGLLNELEIDNTGDPLLKTRRPLSPVGELGYYEPLFRRIGLKFGLGVSPIPYHVNYKVAIDPSDMDQGYYEFQDTEYSAINYYVFAQLTYSLFITKNLYIILEAGGQLNYLPPYSIGISHSVSGDLPEDNFQVFRVEMDFSTSPSIFPSIKGDVCFEYSIHSNHVLLAGINVHYYPRSVATGNYLFNEELYNSNGTLSLGMNYMGILLGYGFRF